MLLCPMLPCTRIPGGILYPPHGGIAAERYAAFIKKENQYEKN
jgi:hypothetical protein